MNPTPDLVGARTFREAARPDAVDRWRVVADGTVVYERTPGKFESSIIAASTVIGRDTWTEVA